MECSLGSALYVSLKMSRSTFDTRGSPRSREPDPRLSALRYCARYRATTHWETLPEVSYWPGTSHSRATYERIRMTIRVLLIDDHPVVRAGLRALLETESDVEVVGEAAGAVSGISVARRLRPDVVVTDLLLPDGDGVAVTQSILAELPGTQVVVLTSASEDDVSVVRAIRAGAIGYVLKSAD